MFKAHPSWLSSLMRCFNFWLALIVAATFSSLCSCAPKDSLPKRLAEHESESTAASGSASSSNIGPTRSLRQRLAAHAADASATPTTDLSNKPFTAKLRNDSANGKPSAKDVYAYAVAAAKQGGAFSGMHH